ncbi:hypothetical protein KJQ62_07855, partial [Campylobacter coli]|nr:hypothetical protein [Campylobacter coli]
MKVVIVGSSHSQSRGIPAGFREEGWNVSSLSIGGSSTIFILLRICDAQNKKLLEEADLIVCESNSGDSRLDTDIACQDICDTYRYLYSLKKKVVICLWSHHKDNAKNQITDNLHIKLSNFYGFNLVNLSKFKHETIYFLTFDGIHMFLPILKELGRNIAKNFDILKYPKEMSCFNEDKKFEVCQVDEMLGMDSSECKYIDRFIGGAKSILLRLSEGYELEFPKKYHGYKIHSIFSDNLNTFMPSAIAIVNKNIVLNSILFPGPAVKRFGRLISIDEFIKIKCNSKFIGDMDEKVAPSEKPKVDKYLGYVGIISFLLVKNYHTEEIDFESLANENIEVSKEYSFNHLVPPIEFYKEI